MPSETKKQEQEHRRNITVNTDETSLYTTPRESAEV